MQCHVSALGCCCTSWLQQFSASCSPRAIGYNNVQHPTVPGPLVIISPTGKCAIGCCCKPCLPLVTACSSPQGRSAPSHWCQSEPCSFALQTLMVDACQSSESITQVHMNGVCTVCMCACVRAYSGSCDMAVVEAVTAAVPGCGAISCSCDPRLPTITTAGGSQVIGANQHHGHLRWMLEEDFTML